MLLSQDIDKSKYPEGLDFEPGLELHDRIKTMLIKKAQRSYQEMAKKFPTWEKLDHNLTSFVPLSDLEKQAKIADSRLPIRVVVPMSLAILETFLSYYTAAFLGRESVFRYLPREPGDLINAALLEHVVQAQVERMKIALKLHTMWRSALVYGIGPVCTTWAVRKAFRTVRKKAGFFSKALSAFMQTGTDVDREQYIVFEGSDLVNIDPYKFLPDPDVPIDKTQQGEFYGWTVRTNKLAILEEADSVGFFNTELIRDKTKALINSVTYTDSGRDSKLGISLSNNPNIVDVMYVYSTIVPKDLGLGSSSYPEKWLFALAGNEYIILAVRLELNHDMTPVLVDAPLYDGFSLLPLSLLESFYGYQEIIDFMLWSHITNVRKGVGSQVIFDPYLVNSLDLMTDDPVKYIRLRKAGFGRGLIDKAVMQLPFNDVTRAHMGESQQIMNWAFQLSGAQDSIRGVPRSSSERISATEFQATNASAVNRLAKMARISSLQTHQDIAFIFASQTQQLMQEKVYVKLVGELANVFQGEYDQLIQVKPGDINVPFDVRITDGSLPDPSSLSTWVELFRILSANESLAQQFDIARIFKHIARLGGAVDVDKFVLRNRPVSPVIAPDDEVELQRQRGNILPIEG